MNNEKEKEIWLEPDEIKQLLEGGLYWNDIESKFSPENIQTIKRSLEKEDLKPKEPSEIVDVRTILLGENFVAQEAIAETDEKEKQGSGYTENTEEIKTEFDEGEKKEEIGFQEKESFAGITESILGDDIQEEKPTFGGLKLVLLLIMAAATTFGVWYYFINR